MGATDVSGLGYSPVSATQPAPPLVHAVIVEPKRACDRVLAWVDEHRYKLYAALVVFYLLGFNGQWRPEPDSALYLTIGRNLALGDGRVPWHLDVACCRMSLFCAASGPFGGPAWPNQRQSFHDPSQSTSR